MPGWWVETLRLLRAQTVELGTVRERIGRLIRQVDQAELGAGSPDRALAAAAVRLARGGMRLVRPGQRADGLYAQQVAMKTPARPVR